MALIEGCKHSLEITVPETEVDQETERAAAAIQVKVRLPGFRPGKAPLAMVKTRFAERHPAGSAGKAGPAIFERGV